MNELDRLRANALAKEHRRWLEGLLRQELHAKMDLYEQALRHGYKHGFEDREKEKDGK